MGTSSAPEFPYPGGTPGSEPADPVAGRPGHFAWSRWIKAFVKRLDTESVKRSGDTMEGPLVLKNGTPQSQLRVDPTGLIISTPVTAGHPVANGHLTTKSYVDGRVPLYHEATMTADVTGWATAPGLKYQAVVFSVVDVSSTPAAAQLLLDPATNAVYLGPSATRKIRFWYV